MLRQDKVLQFLKPSTDRPKKPALDLYIGKGQYRLIYDGRTISEEKTKTPCLLGRIEAIRRANRIEQLTKSRPKINEYEDV